MAEILRSDNETIALIRDTLRERDPTVSCVVLGSAAVVAHFFQAGVKSPVECSDVDALCSQEFFNQELLDLQSRPGISKFAIRWPKGRLALRGARNMSIDIYPQEGEALLPFTAAHDMSDAWISETYEDALLVAVEQAGITCKPIDKILMQIAVIGRDKDIANVKKITPVATEIGLISGHQSEAIYAELEHTISEAARHPDRYYARIDI